MTRVLFATPYRQIGTGGISKWAEHIIDYWNTVADEVVIDVLPMNRQYFVAKRSLLWRFIMGIKEYGHYLIMEYKMLHHNKYDVLHLCTSASFSLVKDILMLYVAHRAKVYTVLHFHFGRIPELQKKNNWEWKLLCKTMHLANVVVPIDKSSYNTLLEVGIDNVVLLPNPLSPVVHNLVVTNARECFRTKGTILYVGHCLKTKGVYDLVEACKTIKDINLILVGKITDEDRDNLKKLAGQDSWLNIMGERAFEEIPRMMLSCSVFTLPSHSEGFPNVILESMDCGCAIVATCVGAIPEMLDVDGDSPCGICVQPHDINALRNALCKMLEDDALALLCGANAQKRVNQLYSMQMVWKQLVRIWSVQK